uniref:Uncharacterized protein n=1 Tax=Chelonoidis abingdonii TaxID=106734 RepID=A0A8C0HA48_CHEAB
FSRLPKGQLQEEDPEPPRRFVLLSLFSTFFCNVCCLGFVALVFSFKARDRNVLGDTDGAGSNVKTVKCLNIAVLVLGCSVVLVFIILYLFLVPGLQQCCQRPSWPAKPDFH